MWRELNIVHVGVPHQKGIEMFASQPKVQFFIIQQIKKQCVLVR